MNKQDDYIEHFGIPGMRWGVRRTPEQLGNKIDKLLEKNKNLSDYISKQNKRSSSLDEKSLKFQNKQSKWVRRINKASAKKAKYESKIYKQNHKLFGKPNTDKIAKYMAKSMKQQYKIDKAQRHIKFNKYKLKSDRAKSKALEAENYLRKNERMISIYKNTIRDINSGTIDIGKSFIMRYSEPDK